MDETRPWRMRKVSAVEEWLGKVESGDTPGGQLRALASAYEEARKQAQADLEVEHEEMSRMSERRAKADAQAKEELEEERRARRGKQEQLERALEESRRLHADKDARTAQMQREMEMVEAHATEKAGVEARRLEAELAIKAEELRVTIEARVAADASHAREAEDLRSQLAETQAKLSAAGTKLAACAAALSATRAAGKNCGYYCSAAPSAHYRTVHGTSPGGMGSTGGGGGASPASSTVGVGVGLGIDMPIRDHIEMSSSPVIHRARFQQQQHVQQQHVQQQHVQHRQQQRPLQQLLAAPSCPAREKVPSNSQRWATHAQSPAIGGTSRVASSPTRSPQGPSKFQVHVEEAGDEAGDCSTVSPGSGSFSRPTSSPGQNGVSRGSSRAQHRHSPAAMHSGGGSPSQRVRPRISRKVEVNL